VNKPRWHDLSFDQWVKLWDFAGFRWVLADALYGLARSKMADVKTRLLATQAINEAIHAGILERDTGYPELLRDVLIECARPAKKVAWWRRRRVARQHAAAREQLKGATWLLRTSANIVERTKVQEPAGGEDSGEVDTTPEFS
jgi:hypothetical protein